MVRLEALRISLLRLHKVLLDFERIDYEKLNGPVHEPSRLLSLVMSDPFFDWLHRISKTIVRIDELQDADDLSESQQETEVAQIFSDVKNLILPTAKDSDFTQHYKSSLKRNPGAVLAHAAVLKVLHDD